MLLSFSNPCFWFFFSLQNREHGRGEERPGISGGYKRGQAALSKGVGEIDGFTGCSWVPRRRREDELMGSPWRSGNVEARQRLWVTVRERELRSGLTADRCAEEICGSGLDGSEELIDLR